MKKETFEMLIDQFAGQSAREQIAFNNYYQARFDDEVYYVPHYDAWQKEQTHLLQLRKRIVDAATK